ncbi:MAG: hypothetical protein GY862_10075 [Gammaproteobacteria bacterium]|nr:hypothetical protein [Gammaproteobacteria bacterium]
MQASQHMPAPDSYQAGGIIYRKAGLSDDAALKAVLQNNTMDSWINLTTEHEPSYFDSAELFGVTTSIIARTETSVVGMCSWSAAAVHLNGRETEAAYLGELRVMPKYRNRLSIIRNGFRSVQVLSGGGRITCWFTSIAKENIVARRLLESGLKGMPLYQQRGEMTTMALSSRAGKRQGLLQQAQAENIPALAEFYNNRSRQYQYSPVLTETWLRNLSGRNGLKLSDFWLLKDGNAIRACLALWDQRGFKQTVVRGYRFPLTVLRGPYNLLAWLSGRVMLPAAGERINYIFISFLAMDEQTQPIAKDIISAALYSIKIRDAKIGMLGLSSDNPVLEKLSGFPHETYHTCIDSVDWPGHKAPTPDPRLVQPEIAIL